MYARVTFSQISPDKMEDVLGVLRDKMLPVASQQKGYKGYLLLGDQTGKGISITFWETEDDRAASDQPSEYYRDVMAQLAPFFKGPPSVENHEVIMKD